MLLIDDMHSNTPLSIGIAIEGESHSQCSVAAGKDKRYSGWASEKICERNRTEDSSTKGRYLENPPTVERQKRSVRNKTSIHVYGTSRPMPERAKWSALNAAGYNSAALSPVLLAREYHGRAHELFLFVPPLEDYLAQGVQLRCLSNKVRMGQTAMTASRCL
jgi:hypothetical protein